MSTENENRPNEAVNEENQYVDEENRQVDREGGYQPQDEQRPYRTRIANSYHPNYNREGNNRPYHTYHAEGQSGYRRYYNNRPHNPRFNPNNENDMDNGQPRPYRPRMNNYNPDYRRDDNAYNSPQRLYRPRPNSYYPNYRREEGESRPYRPHPNYNNYNNDDERLQRPYTPRHTDEGDMPAVRMRRPRIQNGNSQNRYRPRFQQDNRPYRPRTADYNPNAKYNKKKQIEYKEVWIDPNEPIRLNKYLANAGICSRREADEFITAGAVSVNGQVVTELGTKIIRSDDVKFHGESVKLERKVYILLNKPRGYITTSDDPQERKTVKDLVKNACAERIYPVGRLDRNTTGVLLLTNDGDLASKLTHPKFLKKKIYHVYLDKPLVQEDMDRILSGIILDDGEIHADAVSYVSETDKTQVGIEIHSGRNRIVRRLFEAIGYKVYKLDRVYFTGLTKKGLRRGDWRFLTENEVNILRMGAFE